MPQILIVAGYLE